MMMGIESNEYQQRASLETLRAAVATGDPGRARASLDALAAIPFADDEARIAMLREVIQVLGLPPDATHDDVIQAIDSLLNYLPDRASAPLLRALGLRPSGASLGNRREGLVFSSAPVFADPEHCGRPSCDCRSTGGTRGTDLRCPTVRRRLEARRF
jgi:hypothetical protein